MIATRIRPRLRLWAIFNKLGYVPWRKPKTEVGKNGKMFGGAGEIIPFLNDDAKRTFSHLLLRPGYMMRDYVLGGQHERYLSPLTALLVFYSVFTLIVAIVKPGASKDSFDDLYRGLRDATVKVDSTGRDEQVAKATSIAMKTMADAILITRLDLHPEEADTPWKESLAAIEGDLRGKGIPLFLGNFLLLWFTLALLLRKRGINVSGSAAISAYVLCQFCIFMFLALIFSFGNNSNLGLLVTGILLFIDYRQLLGIAARPSLRLTIRTGLVYLLLLVLFYLLLVMAFIIVALLKV